jgi:predicted phage terminase large subunit-like protein
MRSDRELLDAIYRTDLYSFIRLCFRILHPGESFVPAWHIEVMARALERAAFGNCRRLQITLPPRNLKSISASVALVAWVLGRDPSLEIVVASYGADLAAKHARDFRIVIESPEYKRLFPRMRIDPRRNTEAEIRTTLGGGRKAVSLGGALTGFGADLIIADDLMKAADAHSATERKRVRDYYDQTLFSRMNDKRTGRVIAVQQRLHEDDLAAYLIDKGFEHLNLPAIADQEEQYELSPGRVYVRRKGEALFPAREPLHVLDEIRREIGSATFSAQYLQNPVPPEGNRLRWEWFGTYAEPPGRNALLMVVQSWDTASTAEPTSDFSVCSTWGLRQDGKWLLLDIWRNRVEYPALKRQVRHLKEHWQADTVIIEQADTGRPLLTELWQDGLRTLFAYRPRDDKEVRFAAQSAKIEEGRVLLPEAAPWLAAFRHELLAFPNGRHDDQVDSVSQFLDWTGMRNGRACVETAQNGGRRKRRRLHPRR